MLAYQVIKDFQELIVGAVGFAGVIWALRVNARLVREQRQNEAKEICRGLARELERLEKVVRNYSEEDTATHKYLTVPIFMKSIFDFHVQNIGRLLELAAALAINAHHRITLPIYGRYCGLLLPVRG